MVWTLLWLTACGDGAPAAGPNAVRISGPEILTGRLLPALAHGYGDANQQAPQFEISQRSEAAAFQDLIDANTDIAATTREPTPVERERGAAANLDLSPKARQIVAVNVVAIEVHAANAIESLTYDQVIGLFCTGTVNNWQFLGGEDHPVHPMAPLAETGSREVFEDFFCGPRGIHPTVTSASAQDIAAALKSDPDAVAFGSVALATAKLLGLRASAESDSVAPSQSNAIRGVYPVYSDLYLYTRPNLPDDARRFLEWIGTPPGQDVVDESRFLPLHLRAGHMNDPRPLRETMHFDPASATPNAHSQVRLKLLADELRDRVTTDRHIVLEGFADSDEANAVPLSEARAHEVEAFLKKELPGTYFEIIPRGSDRPIAPNSTPYGRQQNRRVQIYLASEEKAAQGSPPPP